MDTDIEITVLTGKNAGKIMTEIESFVCNYPDREALRLIAEIPYDSGEMVAENAFFECITLLNEDEPPSGADRAGAAVRALFALCTKLCIDGRVIAKIVITFISGPKFHEAIGPQLGNTSLLKECGLN